MNVNGPAPGELLRDRLLLYVRALRLPPREGLELVLETLDGLRDSGMEEVSHPSARDLQAAMERLTRLCAERGFGRAEALPASAPPYNRGSMPPACISATRGGPLLGGAARLLRRLLRRAPR